MACQGLQLWWMHAHYSQEVTLFYALNFDRLRWVLMYTPSTESILFVQVGGCPQYDLETMLFVPTYHGHELRSWSFASGCFVNFAQVDRYRFIAPEKCCTFRMAESLADISASIALSTFSQAKAGCSSLAAFYPTAGLNTGCVQAKETSFPVCPECISLIQRANVPCMLQYA